MYRKGTSVRHHERLRLTASPPHLLAGARQVAEVRAEAEREFFDRVHDTSIAGSAVVGPADQAARGRVAFHVGLQVAGALEDLDDGPEPRGAVLAPAEEPVDNRAALDVHQVEGDLVA